MKSPFAILKNSFAFSFSFPYFSFFFFFFASIALFKIRILPAEEFMRLKTEAKVGTAAGGNDRCAQGPGTGSGTDNPGRLPNQKPEAD
jgi:hypothetical protein